MCTPIILPRAHGSTHQAEAAGAGAVPGAGRRASHEAQLGKLAGRAQVAGVDGVARVEARVPELELQRAQQPDAHPAARERRRWVHPQPVHCNRPRLPQLGLQQPQRGRVAPRWGQPPAEPLHRIRQPPARLACGRFGEKTRLPVSHLPRQASFKSLRVHGKAPSRGLRQPPTRARRPRGQALGPAAALRRRWGNAARTGV